MAFHMPYSPLSSPVFAPPSNPFSNASPTTRRATRPPLSTAATSAQVPAKPGVSMEDWDARCPLPEIATQSVEAIKERATRPVRVSQAYPASEGGSTRPGTPLAKGSPLLSSKSLASMNARAATPVGKPHALHPTQPIATPQAFFDWLALVDRAATHSQEAHFRAHLASLSDHLDTCTSLLTLTSAVQAEVDAMLVDWRSVEEGGRSLQDACARLLGEREELVRAEEEIAGRMEVFAELEGATRMLNAPGESLVMRGDFLDMVERVDACIGFLREHRQYKEAELYLLRFKQCLVRAMTLIRMYFVGSLRALNADVSKRLSEKDVSATATHHLLYTRFRSVAGPLPLSPLLGELERRVAQHPATLGSHYSQSGVSNTQPRMGPAVPNGPGQI
ncbi:unnamed protein product [Peniophora sp. CBMAI 1063]|nr:unnamed protein product [Peniophora sp. CBMAI 1063]